ncbi:MAG: helix-turn-helix transcriptional regulator [Clostridia bacterium]|nr:helix-turn-helix transcriptional regulator [Clostridia bacterium]
MMTRGQRIQKLRSDNSLSQEAFASVLGVSRQSVSKWESDKAFPDVDKLELMCKSFGVSCDWIITGQEILEEAPPEEPKKKNTVTMSKAGYITLLVLLFITTFSAVGLGVYTVLSSIL